MGKRTNPCMFAQSRREPEKTHLGRKNEEKLQSQRERMQERFFWRQDEGGALLVSGPSLKDSSFIIIISTVHIKGAEAL